MNKYFAISFDSYSKGPIEVEYKDLESEEEFKEYVEKETHEDHDENDEDPIIHSTCSVYSNKEPNNPIKEIVSSYWSNHDGLDAGNTFFVLCEEKHISTYDLIGMVYSLVGSCDEISK